MRVDKPKVFGDMIQEQGYFWGRARCQAWLGMGVPSGGGFMERTVETKTGERIRLRVERDAHQVPQVYAVVGDGEGGEERRLLCHGWVVRRLPEGICGGIHAQGVFLEVDRKDWDAVLAEREDLRDRDNLPDIHLVRVFSRGDRFTIDGYSLSARVDRATWNRIKVHMLEVDSFENGEVLEGDHFRGWIIRQGMESEVERLLDVKAHLRLRSRQGG